MKQDTFTRAELLAENLFSLADPWRDRFLTFVAQQALGQMWDGQLPTQKELATWLYKDNLHQTVALLISNWEGTSASQYNNQEIAGALPNTYSF